MRKNKGITLIALIITVVILIILAGTTTYLVDRFTKTMNVEDVKTNMLLIQAQIKTIAEKHSFDAESNQLIGENVTLNEAQAEKFGVDKTKTYYKLSLDDLKTMKLNSIEDDGGYYIVCYDTEEVIYTQGVKNNSGTTLYTLTQIKENN